MNNALLILNAGDIPSALSLHAGLPDCTVYTCDPVLMDQIAAAGLSPIHFLPWHDAPPYHQLDPDAHAAVATFEQQLDAQLQDVLPGLSLRGWQHLNLYYQWLAMRWYSALGDHLAGHLRDCHVHVFVCDKPGNYYFSSFLAPVSVATRLHRAQIPFSAYSYGAPDGDAHQIPDLAGRFPWQGANTLLAHIPTCMYDAAYFHQEIEASNKLLINIPARKFNIPLPAHLQPGLTDTTAVLATLPEAQRGQIAAVIDCIGPALERWLLPQMEAKPYRERQQAELLQSYQAQLVFHFALQRYFEAARPAKMLLSDHDMGLHGPLVGFAQQHGIPVLLVPHAKTVSHVEFAYRDITVLSHPLQGQPVFNAARHMLRNQVLAYPEQVSASQTVAPLRTVSLLLNAPSLNGVYYTRWDTYLDGIRQLADWCRTHGVRLKLRCKPSYTIVKLLSEQLGMELEELLQNARETMQQHVADCDLCLMYDTPTSALLYFVTAGVPVLNPVVDQFSASEQSMGNASLMPPESLLSTIRHLDDFLADPVSLYAMRGTQFRAYLQLFQPALPLRQLL
jgi:hypothetical protein